MTASGAPHNAIEITALVIAIAHRRFCVRNAANDNLAGWAA